MRWKVWGLLAALVLAAYANSFGLGLTQDSKAIVTMDPRIRAANEANVRLILQKNYWWPKSGDGLYRPVTTATLLYNYAVLGNGQRPMGYHVVNFLLHLANVLLLFELALLVFRRAGPAFVAAALWAVHPIATESVTSIVGRADLLAGMSVLGGLLLYRKAILYQGSRQLWAALVLFAIATLGVFSKENAAVLAGLMLLWDLAFDREGLRTGLRLRAPFYGAAAASLVVLATVRHLVLGALPPAQPVYVDNILKAADFWTARLTAIKVIGLDLGLLLWPVPLSCDRSYNQIPLATAGDPWLWIAAAVIVAILAVAFAFFRRNPLWFWLAGFFAITLLPVSNLIVQIGAIMAERFLYLPSVAFAIALAEGLDRLRNMRALQIAVAVLLVLYAGRTFARNLDWKDDLSLSTADVATTPNAFRLHDLRARALFDQDSRRNIDAAIAEEEKAWAILQPLPPERSSELPPTFLGAYYGVKASSLGQAPESRVWFEKAAAVLMKAREISRANEKAYDDLQRAEGRPLAGRTGLPELYIALANANFSLGRYEDAIEACRYATGLNPATSDAYEGIAYANLAMNRPEQAAIALLEKVQMDGLTPATAGTLQQVYAKVSDGACAITVAGGSPDLNHECPRVRADYCQANANLAQSYRESRQPGPAAQVTAIGAQTFGCGR